MGKICGLIITVLGTDVWNDSQFEPLIVGLCLPLSRHPPWKLSGTVMLDGVERNLQSLPQDDYQWGGNILCELLQQTRGL